VAMIEDFTKLPEQAKAWVFPSSRKFYTQEIEGLQKSIEDFLNVWEDMGNSLNCAYFLKHDRFIIIVVDDTATSLTLETHDALIAFIQGLELTYNIVLLDKINVCYKQGEFVQYKDLKDFKKLIRAKGVSKKTIVFNNMITTKGELEYDWEINIMDSWLGRFL
jgi:hypothetical protein